MFEKVKTLRDRFARATSEEEKQQIQRETDLLKDTDPNGWAEAMLLCMKDTNETLSKLLVKQQLEEITDIVSVSYIAKKYFGKTPQWFYQRLNNNVVNGKEAQFTEDEVKTLNYALQDISKKIGSVSVSL